MAWAGYCDQCHERVWLNADGSCPRGHGSPHISGAYWADPTPVPPTHSPEPRRSNTGVIVGVIVGVLLLGPFLCGVLAAVAVPIFNVVHHQAVQQVNTADPALAQECQANMSMIEDAAQSYTESTGQPPSSVKQLAHQGYLSSTPACPDGGLYSYDPHTGRVRCTVHGYSESESDPPTW